VELPAPVIYQEDVLATAGLTGCSRGFATTEFIGGGMTLQACYDACVAGGYSHFTGTSWQLVDISITVGCHCINEADISSAILTDTRRWFCETAESGKIIAPQTNLLDSLRTIGYDCEHFYTSGRPGEVSGNQGHTFSLDECEAACVNAGYSHMSVKLNFFWDAHNRESLDEQRCHCSGGVGNSAIESAGGDMLTCVVPVELPDSDSWTGTHDCAGNDIVMYQRRACFDVANCYEGEDKTLVECQEICEGLPNCAGFSYWASEVYDQVSCIPKSASCTPRDGPCDTEHDHCFFKKPEGRRLLISASGKAQQENVGLQQRLLNAAWTE